MIKPLSVVEIRHVAFRLAREKMTFDELMPDFSTRFPTILESCLAQPFQRFDKKFLYKTLVQKAAILFYLMIKNHPFQNGNKRIAMTSLFVFLYKNKKWLEVDQKKLYNFSVWVACSLPELKKETVLAIERFLKKHLVSLK